MSEASRADTIAYIDDVNLLRAANRIPVVRNRASMVHELIRAYGLLEKMKTVPSWPASEDDVRKFHSSEYVAFLKAAEPAFSDELSHEEEQAENDFGLGFDCPVLPCLWSMVRHLAGGSLTAARLLTSGSARVAINWCGGWHHAQRDSASGFCYVNDIVLAILLLRERFKRVAYVDLDVHHGDGVEHAFAHSRCVLTASLHLREDGFFPGTGHTADVGRGEGLYYALNVPYRAAISDSNFVDIIKCIVEGPVKTFDPECLVIQCGGDALALDKLGGANLSHEGYAGALGLLLDLQLPTLLLGGGGYEPANVARLWTRLTAAVVGVEIDSEIPEHCFFELYGPSFDLYISPSNRRDENSGDYVEALKASVRAHGEKLQARTVEKKTVGQLNRRPRNYLPCYRQVKQHNTCDQTNKEAFDDDSLNVPNEYKLEPFGGRTKDPSPEEFGSPEVKGFQSLEHFGLDSMTSSERCGERGSGVGVQSSARVGEVPSMKRKMQSTAVGSHVEKKGKLKDVFDFDDDDDF